MSVVVFAFWRGERTFTKASLQAALAKFGFEATVLHEFGEEDGFWPIDIAGFKTGLEIYPMPDLEEIHEDFPDIVAALGDRDRGVELKFHSNPAEAGTAVALAAAIAKLADASSTIRRARPSHRSTNW